MNIEKTALEGVILIKPRIFSDDRGYFYENWHQTRYENILNGASFVQDNLSESLKGTVRGLHYQNPSAQGKLVTVLAGEVYDVAVDLRQGSPTFGQSLGLYLSGKTKHQLYIPPGFAHGFQVTSEKALFFYKCTNVYTPAAEKSLLWNDPALKIDWPLPAGHLSPKDEKAPLLKDIPPADLF